MDLSRAPFPDRDADLVTLDATRTKSTLDSFGELGERLRCGECGRETIPRRPRSADVAAFLDEVPEGDECGTCAFVWLHCMFVVAGEVFSRRS